MNNVFISIIIPVYNMEKYILCSIRSIQKQTLKNVEIICIDDGSSDKTCEIVRKEQEIDKRILLIQQEHSGPGIARNKGMEIATGEYIQFLDADDFYYEENALEMMYCAAKKENANACASYKMVTYRNNVIEDSNVNICEKPKGNIWIKCEDFPTFYGFQNFIYKKKVLQDNHIIFPSRFYFEDPPFLCKVLALEKAFLRVPVILYCHRSVYKTREVSRSKIHELLLGVKEMMNLADANNCPFLYKKIMDFVRSHEYIFEYLSLENLRCLVEIAEYDERSKFQSKRSPIEYLLSGCRELMYEEYVFPFHRFPRNSKVVIYGASYIGRALYYQAKKYGKNLVDIVAIVDRNSEKMKMDNLPIQNPSIIPMLECEYFLIAAKLRATVISIREELRKIGVSDNRIIWQDDMYRKKDFYENIYFDMIGETVSNTVMS